MPERTDHNEAMSQHERDSRELRELCAQRDAARAETKRIVALLDATNAERDRLRAEVELYREFYDADRLVNKIMDEVSPGLTSPKGPEYAARVDAAINRRCAAVAAIDAARTTHKETE